MVKSWCKADDDKLASLFRKPVSKGGIDHTDVHQKTVRHILDTFFPERKEDYHNFAPLFRKKCSKWALGKALNNARAKGKSK